MLQFAITEKHCLQLSTKENNSFVSHSIIGQMDKVYKWKSMIQDWFFSFLGFTKYITIEKHLHTLVASRSTSRLTREIDLDALSAFSVRRNSRRRRARASGSSTIVSFDRSFTPAVSRKAFALLSLSLNKIFWSSGWRRVFSDTNFFSSPEKYCCKRYKKQGMIVIFFCFMVSISPL